MHFWVFATRVYAGLSVPRKYGLNWFMPALANSSVGSLSGTTGLDGTNVCPCFLQKKSRNCWRISDDEGIPGFRCGVVDRRVRGRTHRVRRGASGDQDTDLPRKFKGPAAAPGGGLPSHSAYLSGPPDSPSNPFSRPDRPGLS